MKKIFEHYLNSCSHNMIYENVLSFELSNDHTVSFSFDVNEDIDEDFFNYYILKNVSEIDEFLSKVSEFKSFFIKGFENLGVRENWGQSKSITYEMLSVVKLIKRYQEDIKLGYYTEIDYGDGMCNVHETYFFSIQVISEIWKDIKFTKYFVDNIRSLVFSVPTFYIPFFNKNKPIRDNMIVTTLSTNTKVRRLGYFKILSLFLNENKKIPAVLINKKFENYCLSYQDSLNKNIFKKGVIKETKSGISAKPYIELAYSLNFLNKINNICYSGKMFKVYQVLQKDLFKSSNIFELNDFDKVFFLECILRDDYFYTTNLLELLFINGRVKFSNLVEVFQNQLINRLEIYKKKNDFREVNASRHIDTILNRIKKWEKAEVYLEHILMPRLNWMLDLEIVIGKNNEFELTKAGVKVFQHLCIWNDINTREIVSSDAFLDLFMIHLYHNCYFDTELVNPSSESYILEKMYNYIEISFDLFKTLAPNRVTASQSFNYTKYKLYFNDNIKVGYRYILNKLSEPEQDKFIFKYQEQYQDGYIQNKK